MAGEKLIQKALQAAKEAHAKRYIADPLERDINLGKFLQGTKTVNDEGDLFKLYHITKGDISEFIPGGPGAPSSQPSGPAIWLSANPEYLPATHNVGYPGEYAAGTNVMPLWASMKNPLVVEKGFSERKYGSGFPLAISPEGREQLIADGYDSVINRLTQSGQEEYLALHPNQLKSATGNAGTFNPNSPRVEENRGGEVDAALHAARRHFENGGDAPVIPPEFTSDTAGTPVDFRPLNFDALRQANAVRVTNRANPDGTTDTDPNAGFSIVSGWNDAMAQHGDPRSTVTWPDNPEAYGTVADMFANNPEWITPHKYRQILHSARELGMRDEDVYAQPRAHGGTVEDALHAVRHHLAGGGFLSDLFSGPDYLSSGKEASFANMPTRDETNADFFKADRALRLAREVQASEPDRDMPLPLRRPAPEAAPRQQVAAPPPAPAPTPEPAPVNIPHFAPPRPMQMIDIASPPHLTEAPGFGQSLTISDLPRADTTPEINSRGLQDYTLPEAALVRPGQQAQINRAVSLAQNLAPAQPEIIPSAADALAAVEKLHNAGVYSGEALDKAGEMLGAHLRARDAGIPVDEALRLIRAEGPRMVNQGMPKEERPTVQPLAYTSAPTPAPASQAISEAMPAGSKLTARIPDEPHGTALTKQQADYVIRTIAAETSGKTPEETQAIASVILNRINSGKYGSSPEAVLFAKRQFEPWMNPAGKNYPMKISPTSQRYSDARDALEAAMAGEDITRGATHFWGPKAQEALGRNPPSWSYKAPGVDIGETRFHNLSRAEGGEVEGYGDGGIIKKALGVLAGSAPSKVVTDPAARAANLRKFHAASPEEVVNSKWYHGTAREVPNFTNDKPTFVTTDPRFANRFAEYKTTNHAWDEAAQKWVPTETPDFAPNVMPLHVRAENPWDHTNPDHVQAVLDRLYEYRPLETNADRMRLMHGDWENIELPFIQKEIKDLGHDAFFVNEGGQRNLAVYNPASQLKSATGNAGTFDPDIPRLNEAHGGSVDDALRVVREHHADGEAVGQAPVATDNSERVRAADRAADLAKQIQAYEASMASIRQQPQDIQSMTHAPEKPRAPISVEALGKNREFGSAPYDVAGPLSTLAQGAYDMKTAPLYAAGMAFPPAAALGTAIDTAEGVASGSPTQVAMGALGGPLKVARNVIAPLAVATGVTAPDEAEAAVPLSLAKKLITSRNLPKDEKFMAAVKNMPGASIADEHLVLPVSRNQKPEQAGLPSVRGGVFYLPEGSANQRYYTGSGANPNYGGAQPAGGETAVANPLFVKGATGGKAPEEAYKYLMGKDAFNRMQNDVNLSLGSYFLPDKLKKELVQRFLDEHAPSLSDMSDYIFRNSSKGNQLKYALQEAAAGEAVRNAGHDAVLGYSTSRTKGPIFSELFDVRERAYPKAGEDPELWPQFWLRQSRHLQEGRADGGSVEDRALMLVSRQA